MTRPHDMGGRFGDGPVHPEPEDERFHEDWHKRALAITLACGSLGQWNIDVSRHARECLDPVDYAGFSYYEKWMGGLVDMLVDRGLIAEEELAALRADGPSPHSGKRLPADAVAKVLSAGGPSARDSDIAPTFAAGDKVTTRKAGNLLVPGGHTRMPRYAECATGRIVMCHGAHVLPDSNAHRLGEAPEPLYAVAFAASELWLHPEHPKDEVVLDLWQSYLQPAA